MMLRDNLNSEGSAFILNTEDERGVELVKDVNFSENELLFIGGQEIFGDKGIPGTVVPVKYRTMDESKEEGQANILVRDPSEVVNFEEEYEWLDREDFNQSYNFWSDYKLTAVGDIPTSGGPYYVTEGHPAAREHPPLEEIIPPQYIKE